MKLKVEDLEDQSKYRHLLTLPYYDIVPFVLEYIKRPTRVIIFFWSACLIAALLSAIIRINISGLYTFRQIFPHSLLGLILMPVLIVPLHEFLHIIPFFLTGIKNIRIGMDMRQFIFYVTAHREVITPGKFRIVAVIPFVIITLTLLVLIFISPPLWKWSLSLFLFIHMTMCAGDFAMLNFYHINRHRKILTWDDADLREAYFYEEM